MCGFLDPSVGGSFLSAWLVTIVASDRKVSFHVVVSGGGGQKRKGSADRLWPDTLAGEEFLPQDGDKVSNSCTLLQFSAAHNLTIKFLLESGKVFLRHPEASL